MPGCGGRSPAGRTTLRARPLIPLATLALALAPAVATSQYPVYGEQPAPAVTTPPATPAPAEPTATAAFAPTPTPAPGLTRLEQRLTLQVAALRRQLTAERTRHARQLRAARRSSVAGFRAGAVSLDSGDAGHAIRLAAAVYGVSADRLLRVAQCESTLNAHATSGPYLGLFQFGTPLWARTPMAGFSRDDPYAASLAAAWAFARGMNRHWPICGRR